MCSEELVTWGLSGHLWEGRSGTLQATTWCPSAVDRHLLFAFCLHLMKKIFI